MSGRWQVKAFDNFGAPGEEDVYDLGVYDSKEQAIAWAKQHVRESLEEQAPPAVSLADLISRYHGFGEETVVYSLDSDERPDFSARDYAHGIAREVFQNLHRSDVDPVLRAAYRDTDYVAMLPGGDTVIRIGQPAPAVDAWLEREGKRTALVISACNPMSRPLSAEENATRHAALMAKAIEEGWSFVEAVGRSPDGAWSEASLLIADLGVTEANLLARRFEQAGYVWIESGKPASLRIRTTRDTWVEEADLA
jgi:hypothetical protein